MHFDLIIRVNRKISVFSIWAVFRPVEKKSYIRTSCKSVVTYGRWSLTRNSARTMVYPNMAKRLTHLHFHTFVYTGIHLKMHSPSLIFTHLNSYALTFTYMYIHSDSLVFTYLHLWTRVNTSEGECIQVKGSEYKWRWVHTSEGEWIPVKVSAHKWIWVHTSEGEWINVKVNA